jgi:hypothetical protein
MNGALLKKMMITQVASNFSTLYRKLTQVFAGFGDWTLSKPQIIKFKPLHPIYVISTFVLPVVSFFQVLRNSATKFRILNYGCWNYVPRRI